MIYTHTHTHTIGLYNHVVVPCVLLSPCGINIETGYRFISKIQRLEYSTILQYTLPSIFLL